jgi:hypothetical protein
MMDYNSQDYPQSGGISVKKIDAAISRFCYEHPNFGISNLMLYIVAGNVLVYLMDALSQGTFSPILDFVPGAILHGQIWRLVTFVVVPNGTSGLLFTALMLYFYYWCGGQLEQLWGTARFNVFYLGGVVLSAVMGMILGFVMGGPECYVPTASMYYVNLSLFLSIATLYPDMQMIIFAGFIPLPVKAKWLAWFDLAVFAWSVIQSLIARQFLMALIPVVALLNYFIFFGDTLLNGAKRGARQFQHQRDPKTISFKKAARDVERRQRAQGYLHKCCVCGRTDADYPDLEFRYCSRCSGYRCYCMDHINNHVHITED